MFFKSPKAFSLSLNSLCAEQSRPDASNNLKEFTNLYTFYVRLSCNKYEKFLILNWEQLECLLGLYAYPAVQLILPLQHCLVVIIILLNSGSSCMVV